MGLLQSACYEYHYNWVAVIWSAEVQIQSQCSLKSAHSWKCSIVAQNGWLRLISWGEFWLPTTHAVPLALVLTSFHWIEVLIALTRRSSIIHFPVSTVLLSDQSAWVEVTPSISITLLIIQSRAKSGFVWPFTSNMNNDLWRVSLFTGLDYWTDLWP